METTQEQIAEISLEFCVSCPLYKKHVTIDGNCLELKRVGYFGEEAGGFEKYFSSEDNELHDAREVLTLPSISGSKTIIDLYKETPKCVYFRGIRHGLLSRTIRSVHCAYKFFHPDL